MLTRPNRPTRLAAVAISVVLIAALAGCSSSSSDTSPGTSHNKAKPVTLTMYSGQHKDLVDALAATYTKKTGVKVKVRDGEDADLVNQIIAEGGRTKADLYLSEGPGPIDRLADKGLLAKVPAADLAKVDQRLVPSTKDWAPYAARARVMFYNPDKIAEDELPKSILDLSQPKWKGTFAYAPSGGFVSTVGYLIHSIGKAKTLTWLKGIKANGVNEHKNGKVRDTVEAGQHEFGLSNHYYWYVLAQTKGGTDKLTSKVFYFDHADAGGLLLASGAAVLNSSKHKDEAAAFVAWLVSTDGGQAVVAGPDANVSEGQIPAGKGVNTRVEGVPSLASIVAPKVDQASFGDAARAAGLIEQAGMS